jgi:hypothetical protein
MTTLSRKWLWENPTEVIVITEIMCILGETNPCRKASISK